MFVVEGRLGVVHALVGMREWLTNAPHTRAVNSRRNGGIPSETVGPLDGPLLPGYGVEVGQQLDLFVVREAVRAGPGRGRVVALDWRLGQAFLHGDGDGHAGLGAVPAKWGGHL